MDVSAETADLVVKESLQATESAAKLLGSGVKNVAALLLAIAKDNYKVVGKTNSRRLARDPAPAEVIRIKKEDMGQFQKLAKEFGVLFFFAQKKGNKSGYVNVVSTQNYAAQLNAVKGNFSASAFVQKTTGTDNVCERSAVLGSGGGRLILKKNAGNGVTMAMALRDLTIQWEENP